MSQKILFIDNAFYNADQGDAALIRDNFIVKGLQSLNCKVLRGSYDTSYKEYINTSDFKHVLKPTKKVSFIKRAIKQFILDPYNIFNFIRQQKYNILICRVYQWWLLPSFIFTKVFKKSKFVIIINEFLGVSPSEGLFSKFIQFFNDSFLMPLFLKCATHIIVISQEHEKFYKKYNKKAKFIIVPMLLMYDKDKEDKEPKKSLQSDVFNICYAGTLTKSNGVDLLIESIPLIKSTTKELIFHLFGPIPPSYKIHLDNITKGLNNVRVYPPKNNKETIHFLSGCDLLVIPKIVDARSVGYIPAKLGDFLYSATPTLATRVGDIEKYISNGSNGFLCEPTIEDLSRSIDNILNGTNDLIQIGLAGKKTAKIFDYKYQSKIILDNIS